MTNHTHVFLNLINQVRKENLDYFTALKIDIEEYKSIPKTKERILNDLAIPFEERSLNTEMDELIRGYIKQYILNYNVCSFMSYEILASISKQVEIDYLLRKSTKSDAELYYAISGALKYYGIYREPVIPSLQHTEFWKNLIKLLYLLILSADNKDCFYHEFSKGHPDFNQLHKLIEAKETVEKYLDEKICIIDGDIVFQEKQEERIINKIEKRMNTLNLFSAIQWIFNIYKSDKNKNNIEYIMPYKYIINMFVKNISRSTHKNKSPQRISRIVELLCAFINLYQLKENKFESMHLDNLKIVEHLQKQVLYSNFYSLYNLKTDTLIGYIEHLIRPSVDEKSLCELCGFKIDDLINFFKFLDEQNDDVLYLEKEKILKSDYEILNFFSIGATEVNQNYSTIDNLSSTENLFSMNPVIRFNDKFYVIGFQYFKMVFYNAFTEKIRKKLDKNINNKLGDNVDVLVKRIFKSINMDNYQVFSGDYEYRTPKKEQLESDLLIKLEDDIILIENKNKFLTGLSFSGNKSHIFKDLVMSLAFSQKQLFRHERNLRKYKTITFIEDNQKVNMDKENIIKISVSTNNWLSIMNNNISDILKSIINIRFQIEDEENNQDFIKVNKYIMELRESIEEVLTISSNINKGAVLQQTAFVPLELILDKYKDESFINNLKLLPQIKMNVNNILDRYDYIEFLNNSGKTQHDYP